MDEDEDEVIDEENSKVSNELSSRTSTPSNEDIIKTTDKRNGLIDKISDKSVETNVSDASIKKGNDSTEKNDAVIVGRDSGDTSNIENEVPKEANSVQDSASVV